MARLSAVSVHYPQGVRSNDYFRQNFPEVVAKAEEHALAKMWPKDDGLQSAFDRTMQQHVGDIFRGSKFRHALGPDETTIDLQYASCRKVLDAAGYVAGDIDLLISVAFLPTEPGVGNAVYLADRLGLAGNAWNLESACGGPMNAIEVANALVDSGQYKRVLVAVACNYTQVNDPASSVSWFLGDGGGAFLIEESRGARIVAISLTHTADTLGSWYHEVDAGKICMRASPETGRIMRTCAEPHLVKAADQVLRKAKMTRSDVDAWAFHTPTAWFADFAADALGIARHKTISTYEQYANIGPALLPTNIYQTAQRGLSPGQHVLAYSPGSASSVGAMILQWDQVALGEQPTLSPGVSFY